MTDERKEKWLKNSAEYVRVMDVRPEDTIVLRWTYLDLNDGQGPWIPGNEELEELRGEVKSYYPDNDVVLVGPHIEVEVLRKS